MTDVEYVWLPEEYTFLVTFSKGSSESILGEGTHRHTFMSNSCSEHLKHKQHPPDKGNKTLPTFSSPE